MVRYVLTLALLGGLLGPVSVGRAQEKPPAAPEAAPHRVVYVVRNADPAALAKAVGQHFPKGEAQISDTGAGNRLLVSGSESATRAVVQLLEQLDQAPRSVAVEVTLVEVALKKGENGQETATPDFAGPPDKIAARLEELRKSGQVSNYQQLRFTALEGQPVTVTAGGNRPITTSTAMTGRGIAQRSLTYHSVGTNVRATARVAAGNAVVLDLNVTDSRVKPPEGEKDVAGAAIDNAALTTKVSVPPNRPVVAQALRSDGKAGRSISLVIVSARVVGK